MSDPLGPVTIGAREIYDQVTRIGTAVERLADQNVGLGRDIEGVAEDVKDHEVRLRTLERARWPLPTLSALLALAAVVIAGITLMNSH